MSSISQADQADESTITAFSARRKTRSNVCAGRRYEESRFEELNSTDFLARRGFVGLAIEMKKGPDNGLVLAEKAIALVNNGNYRAALEKYRPALAALQTNGDEADVVKVHLMMFSCLTGLQEVSELVEQLGRICLES
jgi:hypothetical protein